MKFEEVFCPECGEKTKIDLQKECNFCQNCGHKISIAGKVSDSTGAGADKTEEKERFNIDEKLEEVKFYYETSIKKKEAIHKDLNPMYYLKAQDLLTELSEQQESDYRIWWELSKPLDYGCEKEANDVEGYLSFNEDHFDKALNLADIETKKKLILKREEYDNRKKEIRLVEEKRLAEEKAEQKRLELEKAEEKRKKQKEIEEKRLAEEKKRQYTEACTVKGIVYTTLEEADRACYEQKIVDDLKEKLLKEKSRKLQQILLSGFKDDLQIAVEKERYEALKCIYQNKDLSNKWNIWYGISVLVCFVIGVILEGTSSNGYLIPIIWAGFGVWIWPIWKIVLVVKNKKLKSKIREI